MRQTIQIHVPRTAGTSMRRHAFMHADSYQNMRKGQYDPSVLYTTTSHVSIGRLMECGGLSRESYDGSFKFAFVRNSWDRLVSLYDHLRFRSRRRWRYRDSTVHLKTFVSFAAEIASGSKFMVPLGSFNTKHFSQANSQLEWLKWGVDFVGRFESLADDWRRVCNEIGMIHKPLQRYSERWEQACKEEYGSKPKTMPTGPEYFDPPKKSKGSDYRNRYTDDLAEAVGKFYAEEIERFNFRF